jgi:hypothetical protein
MDPHHRSFGEKRYERDQLSAKRGRELLADGSASRRIVTVPRHVYEDRREALERIPSRQHPYARPFIELENRQRKSQ